MKLDVYLSNLFVLNQKLHVIHWNVVGTNFQRVHEFTEELYDEMFEKFDTIAELYRMKDEFPPAKIKDYTDKTTIEEIKTDVTYDITESLELVAADLELMRSLALEVREEHDEKGDFVVVNELEDHVADYDKHIWFVRSMLADNAVDSKESKKSSK